MRFFLELLENLVDLYWLLAKAFFFLLRLLCRACDAFFPWLYSRGEKRKDD